MNKDHAIGFGTGVLAGAVIGGIVALLYAPKAGRATRQLIGETAAGGMDTVKEATGGVMETVREAASEASRRCQAAVRALNS